MKLNGDNEVVSSLIYGIRANVPDYLVKNGLTYRIITDHLESPVLVIDAMSGEIVQGKLDLFSFLRNAFEDGVYSGTLDLHVRGFINLKMKGPGPLGVRHQ